MDEDAPQSAVRPRFLLTYPGWFTDDAEADTLARFDSWLANGGLLILKGGATLFQEVDGVLVPLGRETGIIAQTTGRPGGTIERAYQDEVAKPRGKRPFGQSGVNPSGTIKEVC